MGAAGSGRGALGQAFAISAKIRIELGPDSVFNAESEHQNRTQDGVFQSEPILFFDNERIGFGVTCERFCDNFGNNSQSKGNEYDETLKFTFVQPADLNARNHLFTLFVFQTINVLVISSVLGAESLI